MEQVDRRTAFGIPRPARWIISAVRAVPTLVTLGATALAATLLVAGSLLPAAAAAGGAVLAATVVVRMRVAGL